MQTIISAHNKEIICKQESTKKPCNCQKNKKCPLDSKCCHETLVYKAEVEIENGDKKNYIGCTEGSFKIRYNGHTDSFRNEKKKNSTALSAIVWENKLNPDPNVKWSIIKHVKKYAPGDRMCLVCNYEKMYILKAESDKNNINKRSEVASLCVHRGKHKLAKVKMK